MSIATDLYDREEPRKPETRVTSVRISVEDLNRAKLLGINLSELMRKALAKEIKTRSVKTAS